MEERFKKLIKSRLADKGITVVHDNTIHQVDFLRMFFSETEPEKQLHVFTIIPDTDRAKLSWYESVYYDESMSVMDKYKIKTETPIEKAIEEYFLQTFEVGERKWLLRWS